MIIFKVMWIVCVFSCDAIANNNPREKTKTQGRQSQNFFPQHESSNPNFQGSPSDVYFMDGNNQVQTTKPKQQDSSNTKFSPNLQADLYNQQYGAQQQSQQFQSSYQPQNPYTQQVQSQYAQSSKPFYPTPVPVGNEVNFGDNSQQQYSPQSQQYVDNNNFVYTDPTQYQSQPDPYDQGYSQVVTGSYLVGERPQINVLPQQRPMHSLYNPQKQSQYGGSSRPIYQSQQNYPLRPPSGPSGPSGFGNDNEGTFMQSVSNFFNNIGQSASEIFSGRPPVSQYNPPPSVGAVISNRPPNPYQSNQQFGAENQPFGSMNPLFGAPGVNPINQFSKAIEEITRNDDFQCIPKVICQMVGSQRRQPTILSSPIFAAIISAVPSTSAGLVYGRAALLGLISGEHSCNTAYPRCPRNEDDLLYYLNNHRGGFFRFFNGGAAFGEDLNNQYNPQQQQQQQQSHYQQNQYQQNQYQQGQYQQHNQQYQPSASNQFYQQSQRPSEDNSLQSNLASLQNIADVINNSGGINLSNLGANANLFSGLAGLLNGGGGGAGSGSGGFDLSSLGSLASLVGGSPQPSKPSKAPPNDQGQSLTELVGNLLTGFVGQRFSSRKIHKRHITKRSIDVNYNQENSTEIRGRKLPKKISAFKLKLAASKGKFKFPEEYEEHETLNDDEIEGRIINQKPAIYSNDEDQNERFVFDSNRDGKKLPFANRITGPTPLPNFASNSPVQVNFQGNNDDEFRFTSNRRPKLVNYQSNSQQTNSQYQQNDQGPVRFFDSGANQPTNQPTKMIFPDRTGTGNLRFDRDEYSFSNQQQNNNRFGKILFYGNQQPQYDNGNRVTFGQNDRYSTTQQNYRPSSNYNYHQNQNQNQQQNQQQNQHQNNYYHQNFPTYNRYTSSSSSSQRDDNSSQNIYVTNGEGKTVYYINAQGKKVYV